jgi:hypothetical protein
MGGLGDGYRLDAGFILWEERTYSVPGERALSEGDGWALFAVENRGAHPNGAGGASERPSG